jgi:hypothetical protein
MGLVLVLVVAEVQPIAADGPTAKAPLRGIPLPGLDQAQLALKLVDRLTSQRPAPITRILSEGFTTEEAVVVAKETINVTLRGEETNWRGSVEVEMKIPCRVHYTVDLRDVPAARCRWDQQKQVLYVPMPPLRVYAVELIASKRDITVRFTRMRFGFYDSDTATEVENRLLKESFEDRVQEMDAEKQSFAIQAGRDGLRQHLRRILQLAAPGVEVIVE